MTLFVRAYSVPTISIVNLAGVYSVRDHDAVSVHGIRFRESSAFHDFTKTNGILMHAISPKRTFRL